MGKVITASNKQPFFHTMGYNTDFKSYKNTPFNGHYSEEWSQNSEKIKESFFRNPQFQTVYKNFNYDEPLWVWIGEGNYDYNQVGYQKMFSYPYDEYKFDVGDYITCIYNDVETTWLITSINKNQKYNVVAHIEKTNNSLRWIDDYGNILSYRCVASDKYLEAYPRKICGISC